MMNRSTYAPLFARTSRAALQMGRRWGLVALIAPVWLMAPKPVVGQKPLRAEAGVDFNFVEANAPPGQCGCFSAFGGDAYFAWNASPRWAAVGQVSAVHAGNVGPLELDVMLSAYLAGGRYSLAKERSRWVPYAEVLIGVAHTGGGLAQIDKLIDGYRSVAFAGVAGGGLEYKVRHSVSIRLIEGEYYATTFANGVNDHQNNFRISAGLAVRIGKRSQR